MKTERLQKIMAHAGLASRRACEELIRQGRVTVNGRAVEEMGLKVDPSKDRIAIDGRILSEPEAPAYWILNKPSGFITTVRDPRGRRTVLDLVGELSERVYPVGRLDYDTEGLLLLTNDGELTHALTHPRHEVPKTYLAVVEGVVGRDKLAILKRGVRLSDGPTAPAGVRVMKVEEGTTSLEITIHEGRNRQIRRMMEAVGHPVTFLKRVRFGPLTLRGLRLGEYRPLRPAEVEKLRAEVEKLKAEAGDFQAAVKNEKPRAGLRAEMPIVPEKQRPDQSLGGRRGRENQGRSKRSGKAYRASRGKTPRISTGKTESKRPPDPSSSTRAPR